MGVLKTKMSAGTKRSENEDTHEESNSLVDGGPGLVYMPYVVMEDLLDKLKLLITKKNSSGIFG